MTLIIFPNYTLIKQYILTERYGRHCARRNDTYTSSDSFVDNDNNIKHKTIV